MEKLRRFLSLALALAILVCAAGCGSSGEKTSSPSQGADDDFFTDSEDVIGGEESNVDGNTSKTESKGSGTNSTVPKENKTGGKSWNQVLAGMPKSLRGTTVTVYNWNNSNEYTGANTVIKKFEQATGIKVVWKTQTYETYLSKLASLVAAGNSPDAVRLNTPQSTGLISMQPVDVTKYDFSDEAWDSTLMKSYTINGKAYGLSLANTHIGSVDFMMYNKSLISKYDLEDPYQLWKKNPEKWTWKKFLKMCQDYKSASGAEFACGGGTGWQRYTQLFGVPGPIAFDGKKYTSQISDATFIKVSQEIADLYNTSHLFKNWASDDFNNGDCLFWAGSAVYARMKNSYFASLKSAGTLNVVPFPSIDGQSTYYIPRGEYEAYGIAKGAKNAAAVPYFLRYFLDASNYDLSAFFCSSQALDVYNWCMKQKNAIWSVGYSESAQFYPGEEDGFEKYKDITGAQVESFMKSNAVLIDARVKRLNQALNQMK